MRNGNTDSLTQLRGRTYPGRPRPMDAHLWTNLMDLDPRLALTGAVESEEIGSITESYGKAEGRAWYGTVRKKLTVSLQVHIKCWEPRAYMDVIEKLQGWAGSGQLYVSWRPGESLEGRFTGFGTHSPRDWAKPLTLTYTAARLPYWVRDQAEAVSGQLMNISQGAVLALTPGGDGPYCFLEGECWNLGNGMLDQMAVTAMTGEQVTNFTLDGLGISPGQGMRFFYEKGWLRIMRLPDWTTLLPCRTGRSSDDLLLKPGVHNTLHLMASQPCRFTFSSHGTCR